MRSVEVNVTTLNGNQYVFKDTSETPNAGSTALTQIGADEMIHSAEAENGEMYIPFHAISLAEVTVDDSLTAPVDDLCGSGSSLCDHETINVYPTDYETPLPWWEERISVHWTSPTDIGFSNSQGMIQNFTATIDREDVATVEVIDDGYGNNKLRITTDGSISASATITVNFPDYGCELTIMIQTISK